MEGPLLKIQKIWKIWWESLLLRIAGWVGRQDLRAVHILQPKDLLAEDDEVLDQDIHLNEQKIFGYCIWTEEKNIFMPELQESKLIEKRVLHGWWTASGRSPPGSGRGWGQSRSRYCKGPSGSPGSQHGHLDHSMITCIHNIILSFLSTAALQQQLPSPSSFLHHNHHHHHDHLYCHHCNRNELGSCSWFIIWFTPLFLERSARREKRCDTTLGEAIWLLIILN